MTAAEKLIEVARNEIGYVEKRSNADLDSKLGNAGSNNYTKYARDLFPNLQGQPWCDMYVDWCHVQAFGRVKAMQLIGGGFSAYTPTSAQYYKNKGWWKTSDPKPGDQIFFKNNTRIYHTGIVTNVLDGRVHTIEGNTSGMSGVVANGGAVCEKSYLLTYEKIAGYGRPDWSIVESPLYVIGWNHDAHGWWYADTKNTYIKDRWAVINGHRYYFNKDGYALTGWQEINDSWYYFEPRAGHPLECALYVTDQLGIQKPGEF